MEFSTPQRESLPARARYPDVSLTFVLAVADVVAIGVFFLISYSQATAFPPAESRVWKVTDTVFCVSILYVSITTGVYSARFVGDAYGQISRILIHAALIAFIEWLALLWMGYARLFDWPYSGPLNHVATGVLLMCFARIVSTQLMISGAKKGRVARRLAVVGAGPLGKRLLLSLLARGKPWTTIIGVYDDRIGRDMDTLPGYPIKGTVQDLVDYARNNPVDEILVALPWSAEARLMEILETLKSIPANIRLAPDAIGQHFLDHGFDRVDGLPVFNIFTKPISGWGAAAKRAEDLVLGLPLLVMAAPIMALCALAIRLDSRGPILFRQTRYGYNNQLIGVYKFRSMYHDMCDAAASKLTTRNDPRVTRVGHFLRRTSLDELPQLFNVINGEMSLVGPRPHALQAKAAGRLYQEIVQEYAVRHKVKPGITGWAQVSGWRGETDTKEKIEHRVEHDLYYMENWSIAFDVEILFRTALVLVGNNTY